MMTGTTKRKIGANKIVADIRSGMSEAELKSKYGLCHNSLKQVLDKLTEAGRLTENELRTWSKSEENYKPDPRPEIPASRSWRCPSCDATLPEEPEECPRCGVVLRKLMARRDHEEHPPPSVWTEPVQEKSWSTFVVSLIVLAIVGTGLILWSKHRGAEQTRTAALNLRYQMSPGVSVGDDSQQSQSQTYEPSSESFPQGRDAADSAVDLSPSSIVPGEPSRESVTSSNEEGRPATSQGQDSRTKEPASSKYRTGVLRQFSTKDFKEEVVEASKAYPVIMQFYSST